jgi:hypothetical protein
MTNEKPSEAVDGQMTRFAPERSSPQQKLIPMLSRPNESSLF